MKYLIKTITLFTILALTSCSPETKETFEKAATTTDGITISQDEFDKMGLELGKLQSFEISEIVKANGIVDVPPENIAQISYPISGFIHTLGHNILEGKYVRKGSTLATVKSMELIQLQQDYLQHYYERTFLSQELDRQKTMNEDGAGTKKSLQEAENKYKVNQSLIASFEAKLNLLDINISKLQSGELIKSVHLRAPFSGYIEKVHIHTGTNFSPGDVLFEMISKDHLHVELKIFEKDVLKLKKGQKVSFNNAGLQKGFEGTVFLVGQTFESDSKAINVHVHISDSDKEQQLIPGQYLSGSIFVDSRNVLSLPETALLREEGKTFVYETSGQKNNAYTFKKKLVSIGTIQNGRVEITSPLDLQEILVKKVNFLTSGSAD